ncbi:MAG TPA: response regulator [Verrucomicrobiae bacterium]|nr:response regulator [Verrucomicrobiae bacterium]
MKPSLPTALIIDDELQIRRLLRAGLEGAGYRVVEADSGQLGISQTALCRPDVVVLDLGLADMEGREVLRRIREWSRVPVLVASVRDDPEDKVAALDAGADDYVTKPFDSTELLARLRAIQRRADPAREAPEFIAGSLRIDFVARLVRVGEREIHLTPIEYALLRVLARNVGKVVSHRQLLREVWGPNAEQQSQYLRVHLAHVRQKLAEAGINPQSLRTEPGIGYRLALL